MSPVGRTGKPKRLKVPGVRPERLRVVQNMPVIWTYASYLPIIMSIG